MATREARWQQVLFFGAWLVVILISVVDGYLALRHRHMLRTIELNPLGRALIDSNDGAVWHLLAAKFAGTVLACAAVLLIRHARPRLGLVVVLALALFQFSLLLYLLLA
jgi:hypothetical protein